ncbi:DinB family protein [Paenibacillus agilis]|uniref:DinB family protein n=1 Tax=Paenibacillus agilis TaxID=3020863 RepID=A0A559IVX1_9BACL|nr:DinB family protein [Paenibacillus agilis]TVX91731.1 DinB family protein [Paenibacillus agilis]
MSHPFEAVQPIWSAVRDRFQTMIESLQEADMDLNISDSFPTIAYLIRHNAEVEYMFADWFFKRETPADVTFLTAGPPKTVSVELGKMAELISFSVSANAHLIAGMKDLPQEDWDKPIKTPIGTSTPREALGRAMYHTGIHSGQISYIRKLAAQQNDAAQG